MKILVGLIGIPLGFVIMIYRERIKRFTGDIAFAEKHLGVGGTYTFILIIGFAVVILSILYVTGTFDIFLEKTIGRFFNLRGVSQ